MGVAVNHRRLPRRVHLGLGFVVDVVLASRAVIHDVCDAEDHEVIDGCWDSHLGDDTKTAGIIYIYKDLPRKQKFTTYWHELDHAINDIRDYSVS